MMPKPTRSIATVDQIVPNPAGSGARAVPPGPPGVAESDRGVGRRTLASESEPAPSRQITSDDEPVPESVRFGVRPGGPWCRWRCPRRRSPWPRSRRGARRRGASPSRRELRRAGRPTRRPQGRSTPRRLPSCSTSPTASAISRTAPASAAARSRSPASLALLASVTVENSRPIGGGRVEVVVHAARNASSTVGVGIGRRQLGLDHVRANVSRRSSAADGVVGGVLVDVDRRAVVRPQHEQPVGPGVGRLDEVEQVREVVERLRHLLAVDLDEAVVHPVRANVLPSGDGLGPLVLVVREREVLAAAVEVEAVARAGRATSRRTRCASRADPGPTASPTTARRAWPSSTARSRSGDRFSSLASTRAPARSESIDWRASRP